MRTRWIAVVTTVALGAASAVMAGDPPKVTPVAQAQKMTLSPANLKNIQFKSVVPKIHPQAVQATLRLKFSCEIGTDGTPVLTFVYQGYTPLQTQHVVVHWEVSYCCNGNLGAPTQYFFLYHGDGFRVHPAELPTNLNFPPQGQPGLTCDAYGWLED